jgi:hypothetical protein
LIDDAAAMHPGKCITTKGGAEIWQDHHQDIRKGFDFYIEQPDNSEQQAEYNPVKPKSARAANASRPTNELL